MVVVLAVFRIEADCHCRTGIELARQVIVIEHIVLAIHRNPDVTLRPGWVGVVFDNCFGDT